MKQKKQRPNYVDNKELYAAMVAYKEKVNKWKDDGADPNKKPRVSNYIGECVYKIATHLSYKPCFINYAFREDMVGDGIENIFQYIDNYDPLKYNNPFAYFTQIIYFAFLRRIEKEKKLLYVKMKMTESMNMLDETSEKHTHDGGSYNDGVKYSAGSQAFTNDFVETFERKRDEKKAKMKKAKEDAAATI